LDPSVEFTTARAPVVIAGRVSAPATVSGITLRPESVIEYTVPFESTTTWRGGTFERCVPNTFVTGFSGATPTSASLPVTRLTVRGGGAPAWGCRVGDVRRPRVWGPKEGGPGNRAPRPPVARARVPPPRGGRLPGVGLLDPGSPRAFRPADDRHRRVH